MGNAESSIGLANFKIDKKNTQVYNDWTMSCGTLDGLPVTVFSASHPLTSKKRPYIERALQASRVYRHPGLLRFLGGGVAGDGEVLMVMEEATPLQQCHQHLSPLQITAGLVSVVKTLMFLHDTAGVSHNNLSTSSIFVTPDDTWKLWGLEYSCSFSDLKDSHLTQIKSYCHESAVPPDDTATIVPAYQHARDAYSFASLVDDLLNRFPAIGDVPGAFEFITMLRSEGQQSEWSKRPRFARLYSHAFFQHSFLQLQHNLSTLIIMDDAQRDAFLGGLVSSLREYPEEVVATSFSATLLARHVLLVPGAARAILPYVLCPAEVSVSQPEGEVISKGLFSRHVFSEHIVPHVVELYTLHDLPIRKFLLNYLPCYLPLMPKETVKHDLLPEILLGIQDSNDSLVKQSLVALSLLISALGANCVVGSNRHNIFADTEPKAAPSVPAPNKASRGGKSSRHQLRNNKVYRKAESNSNWESGITVNNPSELAERSSPDGGEDDLSDGRNTASEDPISDGEPGDISNINKSCESKAGITSKENVSVNDKKPDLSKAESQFNESKRHTKTTATRNMLKESPKRVSHKHGAVGFSEIFGDDTVNADLEEDLFHNNEETEENNVEPNISKGAEVKIVRFGSVTESKTDASSEEEDAWSDWDDIDEDKQANNFASVLKSLNNSDAFNNVEADSSAISCDGGSKNVDANMTNMSRNDSVSSATEKHEEKSPSKSENKSNKSKYNAADSSNVKSSNANKGLGEEFDINSIEVKKKPDNEVDLFADLAPTLKHTKFDLERLLEEANNKTNIIPHSNQERISNKADNSILNAATLSNQETIQPVTNCDISKTNPDSSNNVSLDANISPNNEVNVEAACNAIALFLDKRDSNNEGEGWADESDNGWHDDDLDLENDDSYNSKSALAADVISEIKEIETENYDTIEERVADDLLNDNEVVDATANTSCVFDNIESKTELDYLMNKLDEPLGVVFQNADSIGDGIEHPSKEDLNNTTDNVKKLSYSEHEAVNKDKLTDHVNFREAEESTEKRTLVEQLTEVTEL
uniref:Protein-associating with the carboxyl-terminal domain of ezrin n=1 Tax=Hirondellea gigas TaxID=1518452 RepID=A0A6A7G3P8_9CRUS